jgi:HSP20 family molecular chaperone IbpA
MKYSYFTTKDVGHHFEAEVEIPGFKKEEIKLTATQNLLKIIAKNENRYFSESFSLGNKVDIQKITSKLENGILTLKLPKKDSEANSVNILID